MKNKSIIALSLLMLLITGCSPSNYTSTMVSVSYNPEQQVTDYINFPYGSVSIPGKWNKSNYNSSSHQQFFSNEDSITFAVMMGPLDKYEFYKPDMSESHFLEEFYQWDSKYWVNRINGKRSIIKSDSTNSYLVWHLSDESTVNGYFLFGARNFIVYSLFISSDKWNEDRKTIFLEQVYLSSMK
jgi:hypothetical protein